ncbi:MAG: MFS transporter [Actinophytocola sp.]|nr:MFS transporter [Actinophytocola sp.]
MSMAGARPEVTEILDFYGRPYRVGESDRDLLGRSRSWQLGAAWAAMLMASIGQYGYGALMPVLGDSHGWSLEMGGWLFAVWILGQSAAVYPAARVRRNAGISPAATLVTGALLSAGGLIALGVSGSFALVVVVHGMLGGIGAGLIYGTCLGVVARWYPERPSRAAFASGAFAYGAVPFIVVAGWFAAPDDLGAFLVPAAVVVLAVVGGAAGILRDAPEHWWPTHIDPRAWALDKKVNPALRNNRPAIKDYAPAELVHCQAYRVLFFAVTCATAVALFTIAYLTVFVISSGWGQGFAVAALACLAAASGVIRTGAGRAGEIYGRLRVVRLALYTGAAGQVMLLLGGEFRLALVLLAGAVLAGAAAGACIALLPSLVESHFGEQPGMPNFGLFYGAKAIGGLIGVALAGHAVAGGGYVAVLLGAAVVSLLAAGATRRLRQPGRPPRLVPSTTGVRQATP